MKDLLLRDIRRRFTQDLQDRYPDAEISSMFHLLTAHYFGFPRTLLAMEPDKVLSSGEAQLLLEALEKLKSSTPVQYITGSAFFMDLELQVGPGVLIPRPETEELVRWVLDSHRGSEPLSILDIGTGSGCIALGLKKHWREAPVWAMDLSQTALEVARHNARQLELGVRFRQGDIRDPGAGWPLFDIFVSNPPYVPEGDRGSMDPHVAASEPGLALFVPDADPLCIYRAILDFGSRHLRPGGWVYLEVYEAYGDAVCDLLQGSGYGNIELKKDIFGKDRFVKGQRPKAPTPKNPAAAT